MISCIFTIPFHHWRNDDKQNSTQHIHSILPDGVNFCGSLVVEIGAKRLRHKCYRWDFSVVKPPTEQEYKRWMNAKTKCEKSKNKKEQQRPVNANHHGATKIIHVKCVFKARKSKAHSHSHTHTHSLDYRHTKIFVLAFLCQRFCQPSCKLKLRCFVYICLIIFETVRAFLCVKCAYCA